MAEQQQTLAVQQALELAFEHHKADRLSEAEAIYQQLLREDPNQADAIHMLGVLAHQVGKNELAVELITKAIAIRPDFAEAYCNLGLALQPLGKLEEAVDCCQKALALKPDHSQALYNLGNVQRKLGKLDMAVTAYRKALAFKPDYTSAHNNLGATLEDLGNLQGAAASYRMVLALKPDHSQALYNLGNVQRSLGNLHDAVTSYRKALTIEPNYAEALNNLGVALEQLGRLDEALICYENTTSLVPTNAEAHYNTGNALRELDQLDKAIVSYKVAIELQPNYVEAHCNLGLALHWLGNLGKAVACCQKAISINPQNAEAHWNLAIGFLLQGDWAVGWEEFEWRLKLRNEKKPMEWRSPPIEMWTGYRLQDKNIIVYAEQGVGDEIMFSSCIPDLVGENPDKILLECDPRLEPLFTRSFPDVHVCGKKRELDFSWAQEHDPFDYSLPIGSLPKFFRNRVEDFPERQSFLVPGTELVETWNERLSSLGNGLKIGISWQGGQTERVIRNASIPLTAWEPLLLMDACFINLQYGDASEDIAEISKKPGIQIHDWEDNDPLQDLDNQAALISALDLVITIDNSTLHLAGAVGTPTWGLLEYVPDWRWPQAFGNSSPLYPSVRLFRQTQLSEWAPVLTEVEQSLKEFIG